MSADLLLLTSTGPLWNRAIYTKAWSMSPGEKQTLYTYPCEKFFSKVYFLSRKNFWEKGQDQLGKSAGIVKQPQVGKAVGGV